MNRSYYKAIYSIITTGHWITDMVSSELKEFGISEPQFNVLKTVKGSRRPVSVQFIQNYMVQRSSNVSRIIDRLVEKELLEREPCETNRRKVDITITEKGKRLLTKLEEKVEQLNRPMMENLSTQELDTLYQLIHKLKTPRS